MRTGPKLLPSGLVLIIPSSKRLSRKMKRLTKRVEALETIGDRNAGVLSIAMLVVAIVLSLVFLNYINTWIKQVMKQ